VPDLHRPDPPRTLADRARGVLLVVSPARLVAGGLALLVAGGAGWWLVRPAAPPVESGLPRADAATSAPTVAGGVPEVADPTTTGASDAPSTVVVQVAGAVVHAGVYELPAGSRVVDLLETAGGATADGDPDALSLAAVLADGQRVQVPRHGETLPADVLGELAPPPAPDVTGPVSLNAATVEQLDALPGVGPATAAAIVAHRDENGPYASVDDLLDVRGIGPAKLEALRDLVVA
jgi:competence protein ComEA